MKLRLRKHKPKDEQVVRANPGLRRDLPTRQDGLAQRQPALPITARLQRALRAFHGPQYRHPVRVQHPKPSRADVLEARFLRKELTRERRAAERAR